MHDLLNDRNVLVAGGTGNVGRVIVTALLEAGATVAVPSRSADKLDRLEAETDSDDRERLIAIEGHIADERDVGDGVPRGRARGRGRRRQPVHGPVDADRRLGGVALTRPQETAAAVHHS